jgi:LuxR family transcriptional regulator, maltose regulon positive regulatory protein
MFTHPDRIGHLADPWVQRAERTLRAEAEPATVLALYYVRGLLELARGHDADALAAFRAAERLAGHLAAPHYLAPQTRAMLVHALVRECARHAALASKILSLLPAGHGEQERPGGMASPHARRNDLGESPPRLIDPLTKSETRVLRYLPSNLSAPEIANQLYVSPNTVRTHMRNLYAKFGAHRRTEAVARARALGLLAPSPLTSR